MLTSCTYRKRKGTGKMPDPAGLNKSGNYINPSVKKLDRSIMNI